EPIAQRHAGNMFSGLQLGIERKDRVLLSKRSEMRFSQIDIKIFATQEPILAERILDAAADRPAVARGVIGAEKRAVGGLSEKARADTANRQAAGSKNHPAVQCPSYLRPGRRQPVQLLRDRVGVGEPRLRNGRIKGCYGLIDAGPVEIRINPDNPGAELALTSVLNTRNEGRIVQL